MFSLTLNHCLFLTDSQQQLTNLSNMTRSEAPKRGKEFALAQRAAAQRERERGHNENQRANKETEGERGAHSIQPHHDAISSNPSQNWQGSH